MLEACIVDIEGILTEDGQFAIFDTHDGVARLVYPTDQQRKSQGQATASEKVCENLLTKYEHLYIVYPNQKSKEIFFKEHFPLTQSFLQQQQQYIESFDLDQFLTNGREHLNPKGVIIVVTKDLSPANTTSSPQSFQGLLAQVKTSLIEQYQPVTLFTTHFKQQFEAAGIDLPVVNGKMSHNYFCQQYYSNVLLGGVRKIQPQYKLAPFQTMVSYDKQELSPDSLANFKSSHVVIKSALANDRNSKTVAIIPKEQLNQTIKYIYDQTMALENWGKGNETTTPPSFIEQDFELMACLIAIIKNLGPDRFATEYLVQEYIQPAVTVHYDQSFQPAVRLVLAAYYDHQNESIELEVIDGYYQLPPNPISDSNTLKRKETISTQKNYASIGQTILDRIQQYFRDTPVKGIFRGIFSKPFIEFVSFMQVARTDKCLKILNDSIFSINPEFDESFMSDKVIQIPPSEAIFALLSQIADEFTAWTLLQAMSPNAIAFRKSLITLLMNYSPAAEIAKGSDTAEMLTRAVLAVKKYSHVFQKALGSRLTHKLNNVIRDAEKENYEFKSPNDLYKEGNNTLKQKNYKAALELYKAAKAKFTPSSVNLASCCYALGRAAYELENYTLAKENFQLAYDIYSTKAASDTFDTARHAKFAQSYLTKCDALIEAANTAEEAKKMLLAKNYDEATESLFKAAIKRHKAIKPKSEQLSTYHYNLATFYDKIHLGSKAIKRQKKCLSMRNSIFKDPAHESVKKAQDKLEILEAKLSSK